MRAGPGGGFQQQQRLFGRRLLQDPVHRGRNALDAGINARADMGAGMENQILDSQLHAAFVLDLQRVA